MWPFIALDINFLILISILPHVMVEALRDVKVTVPPAVKKGEKAVLRCSYDMEGDSLYSVKWYKGRREFYRYTPKENPAMKMFTTPGILVVKHQSDESQLTLALVQQSTSGKYSCEVSADAPSFHTLIASGELEVVEPPEHKPIISGIRLKYRVGDSVRGNCTSRNSKPAANLTWTINDHAANPSHVRLFRTLRDTRTDLESSVSGIQFVVTPQHFVRSKLKIRCIAYIHDVYWQSTEKSIEEDRQKVLTAAASSNSVNLVQNVPYDQFSLDGDMLDKKDTYMTHMQGDMSSLNAGTAFMSSSIALVLCMFQLSQLLFLYLCNNINMASRKNITNSITRSNRKSKKISSNRNIFSASSYQNLHQMETSNLNNS